MALRPTHPLPDHHQPPSPPCNLLRPHSHPPCAPAESISVQCCPPHRPPRPPPSTPHQHHTPGVGRVRARVWVWVWVCWERSVWVCLGERGRKAEAHQRDTASKGNARAASWCQSQVLHSTPSAPCMPAECKQTPAASKPRAAPCTEQANPAVRCTPTQPNPTLTSSVISSAVAAALLAL